MSRQQQKHSGARTAAVRTLAAAAAAATYVCIWVAGLLAQLLSLRLPQGGPGAVASWLLPGGERWDGLDAVPAGRMMVALVIVLGVAVWAAAQARGRFVEAAAARAARRATRGADGRTLDLARWARRDELTEAGALVDAGDDATGRVVVGTVDGGRRVDTRVAAPEEHHVLVVGHTGSGKTRSVGIPSLLRADGWSAVVTSTKADVLRATAGHRSDVSDLIVWDPSGVSGWPTVSMHPSAGVDTWDDADATAVAMLGAHHRGQGRANGGGDSHWYEAAGEVIGSLLVAARVWNLDMRSLASEAARLDERRCRSLAVALEEIWPEREPADAMTKLAAAVGDKHGQSVLETVMEILRPWRRLPAAPPSEALDVRRLAAETDPWTLYLVPPPDQPLAALASVVGGAVESIWRGASKASAAASHGRLHVPLLLLLDEIANLAPIPSLRTVVTTGRSMGVRALTMWQTLGQVERAYGNEHAEITGNHATHVVWGGTPDAATAKWVSERCGEQAVIGQAVDGSLGTRDASATGSRAPLLAPDAFAAWPRGRAVVLIAGRRPARAMTPDMSQQPDVSGSLDVPVDPHPAPPWLLAGPSPHQAPEETDAAGDAPAPEPPQPPQPPNPPNPPVRPKSEPEAEGAPA